MMHEDDLDLERRLRRISRDPEPLISGAASRYLRNLADGEAAFVDLRKLQRPGGPFLLRMPKSAAIGGLAAAMILVLAGGLLLASIRPNSPAASSAPTAPWSALDWRDITDTAFPSFTSQSVGWSSYGMSIVSWKGLLIADPPSRGIWSSPDGQTWTAHPNLPDLTAIRTTKNWLFGIGEGWNECLAGAPVNDSYSGSIWHSLDGLAWEATQVPTSDGVIEGMAATGSTGVVLVSSCTGGAMKNPATPYASTDGATWTKASVPPDMAEALMTRIDSTRAGFVVSGIVEGAGGDIQWSYSDGSTVSTVSGFDRSWFSADGLSWASYDPGLTGTSYGQLPPVYSGSLGDAMPFAFPGLHSTDGLHWLQDEGGPAAGVGGQASVFVSDGTEIIAAQDGPVFWFSRGDGRWSPLQNGGTLGSLPSSGQFWVVPNGVIYDAGGRIYFGQALAGVTINQTLRPGPPVQYPTVPGATSSLPPLPRGGLEPPADWSGGAGVDKLAAGPTGADSVVAWAHGYLAIRNASGHGTVTVWASSDGRTWVSVPGGSFGGTSGVAAAVGDSVVLATPDGSNGVWASTDGTNWAERLNGYPPIGSRPMVGDARGMVAIEDDPQFQLAYSSDALSEWYSISLPGASPDTVESIALSGDRFVAVGRMPGSEPGSWIPASWSSTDASTWTSSVVPEAVGQSFDSVLAGRSGFLAFANPVAGSGIANLWNSTDGQSWRQLDFPFGPDAAFGGDGTHLVACEVLAGHVTCWSSLDGAAWTPLPLRGDTSALAAAGSGLHVFPIRDGVLFVTADGVWLANTTK